MITKIFGAPGTGKTTRLLDILVQEIKDGVPLRKIAFVTHTTTARDEARQRASKIVSSPDKDAFRYFRTIHGICFREVGLGKQQVMQVPDYLDFGEQNGIPFSTNFSDDLDEDGLPVGYNSSGGNSILAVRQLAAARCCDIREVSDSWPEWLDSDGIRDTLAAFQQYKLAQSKFDFVDMLHLYQDEGEPIDADVVIVDEAQDLSKLQWNIVEKFSSSAKRIYLGGDDDQAIYGFIGADPVGFLRHRSDCDIILPRTYRLKREIFNLSQRIIGGVAERQHKQVEVDGEGGVIDYWNMPTMYLQFEEAKSTMVVARHHKQLSGLAAQFRERGVSFSHGGNTLVGTPRARAVYNYSFLRAGGTCPVREAVTLVGYTPSDKLKAFRASARDAPDLLIDAKALKKETGVDVATDWVDTLAKKPYDVRINEQIKNIVVNKGYEALLEKPTIDLTTYHACKGREADHVILFTDCYISAYRNADLNPDEERRLAYVGVTRARDKLTIVSPETDTFMRALQ